MSDSSPPPSLSHITETGEVHMVDVGEKSATSRMATAESQVRLTPAALEALENGLPKGDVWATVRIAAVMATKKTSDLIPLCHPLPLTGVEVHIERSHLVVRIQVQVKTLSRTGVEMEALTGASVAALTLYDMLKSADKGLFIEHVRLLEKHGGKSGSYVNQLNNPV